MRKMLRLGLCLSVLAAALTCSALAADDEYTTSLNGGTVEYNTETKKYTASYDGAIEGKQYALLVVKAKDGVYEPISDDTIMYIDQKPATETGVSFEFIPKSTPDCVVLLGGVFNGEVTSPVTLGTLIGQGVTVSGSVTTMENTTPATVTLYSSAKELLQTTTTDTNGAYTFGSVPMGDSYYIAAEKGGYVGSPISVAVEDTDVTGADITLYAGDVDGSKQVDSTDLLDTLTDYNKVSGFTHTYSDLNYDGSVNSMDLLEILTNYNRAEVSIANYNH